MDKPGRLSPGAEQGEAGGQWARRNELPVLRPVPGIEIQSLAGQALHVAWIRLAPETEVPRHSHPQEQIGVVIEGAVTLTVGGETRRVAAGEGYAIPGGIEHSAHIGPERARNISSP